MSAFVPDVPHATSAVDAVLPLTGERTIPGLDVENYWFRRHEVVYQRLAQRCAGREVLEAGCGEGYGADLIAGVARRVIAVDYDEATVAHVRARYPRVEVIHGNLAELPLADGSVDVVVNFQVIEHLWDQPQFVSECARVLRPSGLLMVSTPNRITFSPGRDTPINPFHTRELNADELTELLVDAGFASVSRVAASSMDRGWPRWMPGTAARSSTPRSRGRSPTRPGRPSCWPTSPRSPPPTSTSSRPTTDEDGRHIDDSLDLVAIAVRP